MEHRYLKKGDTISMGSVYDEAKYMARMFRTAYKDRNYRAAYNWYRKAVDLTTGAPEEQKLTQEQRNEIYGVRGERGVILQEGLFSEEMVMAATEMVLFGKKVQKYGSSSRN